MKGGTRSDQSRPRLGRGAPRSRAGCVTCKQRHVRCDEVRPQCGHCARLHLHCEYHANAQQRTLRRTEQPAPATTSEQRVESTRERQSQVVVDPASVRELDWLLNPSWAGQPCLFPSPDSWTLGDELANNHHDPTYSLISPTAAELHPIDLQQASQQLLGTTPALGDVAMSQPLAMDDAEHREQLLRAFQKIVQPPATILIGGQRRWRRVQRYLIGLSGAWAVVRHALLCVNESLHIDEVLTWRGQSREHCTARIEHWHALTCIELEQHLRGSGERAKGSATVEALLAAIVLLAWFEVLHDQDGHSTRFPQRLAELIIVRDHQWNRYSRHLLSWLHNLDCRATYMGGHTPLLSPNALRVVSNYPTQIVPTIEEEADDEEADSELTANGGADEFPPPCRPAAEPQRAERQPGVIPTGHAKQLILHILLQPALQWYSAAQAYCRRISELDKHHRRRLTPEDEYEVMLAYKELESELWRLWNERPKIMLLSADGLASLISTDIAIRLHEVFSVHLASFWILFVYLHRVCWWNLPHSPTVHRALEEVWLHLRAAYGESLAALDESEATGEPKGKTVHPTLLWPVFLFGLECAQADRRDWAIAQLTTLGMSKPALAPWEDEDDETLPPFRISSGATRNASRAAILLKELVEQQDRTAARVDDRDLSMKMFGCYFCIV
ncbi:hypothetical protein BJX66DRAFT_338547 [Aspergillus keveii]|uniref:Zn(2)-C6 fungal-type domain-containing protein n=1 Tax=Aspergillus keveii TaxID=714993 RepID=A0ABR4G4T7_9EURO